MRAGTLAAALGMAVALATGCAAGPTDSPTDSSGDACAGDLPPRTSPTDYPVAVLHLDGDDLAPVVGAVDWQGGETPVATTAARAIHLERFTVLLARDTSEMSVRMSDEVAIDEWRVDALPADGFRAGDTETGTEWSRGSEATELICVPLESGRWVIRAELTFTDGDGRGTYYWRVDVDGTGSS